MSVKNGELDRLRAENERLRGALKEIAASKYGQVFTEADVRLLMAFAYLEGRDGKVYSQDAAGNPTDRGERLLAAWRAEAEKADAPFRLNDMMSPGQTSSGCMRRRAKTALALDEQEAIP